ncbi:MAG: hypothetical protein UR23_C0055G0005 [Candidatus Roizmanbacteria bacterium GW2011_GWA2_32_13]|uniref:MFS transporter n=1 Tax=Candidatus Roizmanbacteria bacterium GW2011_GWA2_32_13 TaxID=1618475 RepID=A0A0F9Z2D2_9BACT|nr:MAG: hypothetical protein UR23_C0055G0005 [Candidatus Roizmanbacteria bacterium GW2011_GWA2_32_13]
MINFIKNEFIHFQSLSQKTQGLIISYFFYGAAYPIINTFINSYIWRSNANFSTLAVYRLGHFLLIPIIFFINGFLLKKFKVIWLYFFGSLILALSSISVVFFKINSITDYFILGGFYGIGFGFYWANRNYLTQQETDHTSRNYFFGLSFSLTTIISLIVALASGWLIVFGLSYEALMIIAVILLFISGLKIITSSYQTTNIGKLIITHPTKKWKIKRYIHLGIGLFEGSAYFLPSLLILTMLGNEGILGTLTALASILSAILVYVYGRKSETKSHRKYFIISIIFGLLSSVMLAYFFNWLTIIIYVLLNGLIINFIWLTVAPLIMNNIDVEIVNNEEKRFSYILDGEIFLNIGRSSAAVICLILALSINDAAALRYGSLILSCLQVLLFVYLERIRKRAELTMV